MEFFHNQTLIVKLMGGFVVTSVITMAVGLLGVRAIQTESGAIERIYTSQVEQVSDLKEAQILLLRAFSNQKNALVAYTHEQRVEFLKMVASSRNDFNGILSKFKRTTAAKDQERIASIEKAWGEFERTLRDDVLSPGVVLEH